MEKVSRNWIIQWHAFVSRLPLSISLPVRNDCDNRLILKCPKCFGWWPCCSAQYIETISASLPFSVIIMIIVTLQNNNLEKKTILGEASNLSKMKLFQMCLAGREKFPTIWERSLRVFFSSLRVVTAADRFDGCRSWEIFDGLREGFSTAEASSPFLFFPTRPESSAPKRLNSAGSSVSFFVHLLESRAYF